MYTVTVFPPNTRVNDQFVSGPDIDCQRPPITLTSDLVVGGADDIRFQADFYKYIAADIVVETVFNYPYPYVSEKTLRPISCKRLFIIVGASHTLELLKNKGFHTWHDIIDESYDSIEDHQSRFLAVTNSIKEFCRLPLEEVQQYMRSNQNRLDHNYQTLIDLKTKELKDLSNRIGV